MKFMKYLMTLLAGLLTLAFLLTSCDSGSGEGETVDENAGQQITEGIVFVSYGDGTCYVDGVRAPFGTMNMELVIPEKSPEGDTVIEVRQLGEDYSTFLPWMATQEYFEEMLQDVLEYCGGDEENWDYKKFKSYFQLKGLEFCSNDRLREDLLQVYPIVAETNIYARDPTANTEERIFLAQMIWKACSYETRLDDLKAFIRCYEQLGDNAGISGATEELEKYQAQKIAPWAFTRIELPDTVTTLGDGAFTWCTGLTSITIPDSVTSIGDGAFAGCTGLTSITIPDSVTSIGDGAFAGCTGLTSITIPDSVTSIGDGVFRYCSSLTSITIPDSVTSMSIGEFAFYDCNSLTSITIPDCVTSIGENAFYNCTGLTSITLPDSVTSIGWCAFEGCTGLTSISIPGSVTSIGANAFKGCAGLTSITIPDGVTSIEGGTFANCPNLSCIVVPKSVIRVDCSAFPNAHGIGVYYVGTKEEWKSVELVNQVISLYIKYNYVPEE